MQVDVVFQFAKVYDITRIDVVKGQKFSLETDSVKPLSWFANNDKVLSLDKEGINAEVTASGVGTSTILLMDGEQAIKKLTISVIEEILPEATSLGLSADEPVSK
jgi:membrane carboxypeptidase/penicillin-binding protein PbpC